MSDGSFRKELQESQRTVQLLHMGDDGSNHSELFWFWMINNNTRTQRVITSEDMLFGFFSV